MTPKARSTDLIVKNLDGDMVVYNERTGEAHELNATAGLIWRNCDGVNSVADLARIVGTGSSLPADEAIVQDGLGRLARAGLLEPTSTPIEVVSRRQIMSRFGLAGAAALVLPMMTTVLAPTSAMAQAGPPPRGPSPTPPPTSPPTPPPYPSPP